MIEFLHEMAAWAFPVDHKGLQRYVDEILSAHLGPSFLGVGRKWTSRWIEKHSDQLGTYWARHLDAAHGQAINLTSNALWFKLLAEILALVNADCIYRADECGFLPGIGNTTKVIGQVA